MFMIWPLPSLSCQPEGLGQEHKTLDSGPMTVQTEHLGAGRCSHMVRNSGNTKKQGIENKDRIPDREVKCLRQFEKPVWGYVCFVCFGSSSLIC